MRKRLYICTKSIETDKPSGGGHGPDAPYLLFISIDGETALQLDTHHFRKPGQMAAFTEILAKISARDISETMP